MFLGSHIFSVKGSYDYSDCVMSVHFLTAEITFRFSFIFEVFSMILRNIFRTVPSSLQKSNQSWQLNLNIRCNKSYKHRISNGITIANRLNEKYLSTHVSFWKSIKLYQGIIGISWAGKKQIDRADEIRTLIILLLSVWE